MPFNTRYLDELGWLRDMGREFAQAHPETAGLLAEAGSDPDVERMLEGFAFLTARLRQKLDDELPELTHVLIEELWPDYLQPVPAGCILQFDSPRAVDAARRRMPRGTTVLSVPVDGARCRFRLADDAEIPPMRIAGLTLASAAPARLSLRLRLHDGVTAKSAGIDSLRVHCTGPSTVAAGIHACLVRHCVSVHAVAGPKRVALPPGCVTPVGFAGDPGLRPGVDAQSLLREWFCFRDRLLFVDVGGMRALAGLGDANEVVLEFALSHVPEGLPQVSEANLLLGCAPAVNLFSNEADPIPLEVGRNEYSIRPRADDPAHAEVASVVSVAGIVPGRDKTVPFDRLFRGGMRPDPVQGSYILRREPAVVGGGTRLSLVVGTRPEGVKALSLEIMCTNRRLPQALGPGDVSVAGDPLPPGVKVRNLAKPTLALPPPLGDDLEWRLIAHLGLSQRSLSEAGTLRSLLDLHDVRSMHDQQAKQSHRRLLDAIVDVSAKPDTAVHGGVLVRGVQVEVQLRDDGFDGEGDINLFAMVLDEWASQNASLNSFTRLRVLTTANGIDLRFPPRLGRRRLI